MAIERHFIQEGVIRSEIESFLRNELTYRLVADLLNGHRPIMVLGSSARRCVGKTPRRIGKNCRELVASFDQIIQISHDARSLGAFDMANRTARYGVARLHSDTPSFVSIHV